MTVTSEREDISLADIADMLAELKKSLDELAGKVDQLEAEFAPLARKATRIMTSAAALPGVGRRRR